MVIKKLIKRKSRGAVALLTTFLILTVLLFIVLGLSAIFFSEQKISSAVGRTAASFYAAESGIERALYEISKGASEGNNVTGTLAYSQASYSVSWDETSAQSLGRFGSTRRKVDINFGGSPYCGDAKCNGAETCATCPGDCGACDLVSDCGADSGTEKTSCLAIKNDSACSSSGDGVYWINPSGSSAFQVYCDMTTDGGGWTRCMNNYDYFTRSGGSIPGDYWMQDPSALNIKPSGDPVNQSYDFCAKGYGSAYAAGQNFLVEYRTDAADVVRHKVRVRVGFTPQYRVYGSVIADFGPINFPVPLGTFYELRRTYGSDNCFGYITPWNWSASQFLFDDGGCGIVASFIGQPDDDLWNLLSLCQDYKWCYLEDVGYTGFAQSYLGYPGLLQTRGNGISAYYK